MPAPETQGAQYIKVRLKESASYRAHLIDRRKVREVMSGSATRFVPKAEANPPDASGQLIVKPAPVLTLCEQNADPIALAPLESRLCQTCAVRAGMGKIVAAEGFRT